MIGVEATTIQDEVLDTIIDTTLIGITGTYQSSNFIVKVTIQKMVVTIQLVDVRNGKTITKKREWYLLMYANDPQGMLKRDINHMNSVLNEAYSEGQEAME